LNALEATSIPLEIIKSYVDITDSNKIVLILDCCFSGAAGAAFSRGGVDDQMQLASGGRGTYILTASTGIQVAVEKEVDRYGIFTKHLVEGIQTGEADVDGDGRVTMDEVYRYVHTHVLADSAQEPMKWDLNVRGELVIAQSGKTLREKRNKQIRQALYELAKQELLPEDILDKAREVLGLEVGQLKNEFKTYDDLLQQLFDKRIQPVEFARLWDKVPTGEPPPPKKEPPRAVEPPPPRKEPPPGTVEPPPRPRKKTWVLMVLGALVIGAIIVVVVFWPANQEKERWRSQIQSLSEERIPGWEERLTALEQTIEGAGPTSEIPEVVEALGGLERQIESVMEQLRSTRRVAEEYGMTDEYREAVSSVENMHTRVDNALEVLRTRRLEVGRLFVETIPEHARVRIMNIKPRFEQGMELAPGRYELEISAQGHETQTHMVEFRGEGEKHLTFELRKVAEEPEATPPRIAQFDIVPPSIERGQSAEITWKTEGAEDVRLNDEGVEPKGEMRVEPRVTTEYVLTVRSPHGERVESRTLSVLPDQRVEAEAIGERWFGAFGHGNLDMLSSLMRTPFLLGEKPIIYSKDVFFARFKELWEQHGSEIRENAAAIQRVEAWLISEWYESQGREIPAALLRELELEENDYIVLTHTASDVIGGIFVKRADEGLRVAALLGR